MTKDRFRLASGCIPGWPGIEGGWGKGSLQKKLKKITGRVGEEPGQSGERRKWYMNVLRGGCGYLMVHIRKYK
jgi:hypothetical protein